MDQRVFVVELIDAAHDACIYDMDFRYSDGTEMSYRRCKDGVSLKGRPFTARFHKTNKKKPCDFLSNMYLIPCPNAKVRELLAECGVTNVEYHPIAMDYKGEQLDHDYQIANLLGGRHDIMDWDRSEFTLLGPPETSRVINHITKLVIIPDRVPGLAMFWMDRPPLLMARAWLVERLASAKIKRFRATPVDEYVE